MPTPPGQPSGSDLCFLSATEMAALLRKKALSARELMAAHLAQIERVNPKVNAIVTQVPAEQLLAQAASADEAAAAGRWLGPLHGLPLGVKDMHQTKGIRTTLGSRLFEHTVPAQDNLVVEREKAAGAIVVGKTNVSDLGMGSQTFNPIFGPTLNPYDLSKTCGGSTGGGAVAAACGMVALADGSDFGGSLRNPANFCNIAGFRPSPGRVPNNTTPLAWFSLSVSGPVGRTVADCALLLSAQAGPDRQSPISIEEPGSRFAAPLDGRSFKGVKVAMIKDLGLPWEPELLAAMAAQRRIFEALGCEVEEAEPDLREAHDCFMTWRHWYFEAQYGAKLDAQPDKVNPFARWHVEEGRKLTGPQLSRAEANRTILFHRMRRFMERYEFLVLPVNQVLPFDVKTPYPTKIAGVAMATYVEWMRSAYSISVLGNPAISVPCAFSSGGLPIGLQIVGRHHDDFGVLQMGHAFEQATQLGLRRPPIALP